MAHLDAVRIGISGWSYAGWRGKFYPAKLAHSRELAYSAQIFRSIEVNGTFYSLQRPETFAKWASAVPDDFVFSIKGSRYITHLLRLKNVRTALANFFASGLLQLGPRLGPILWQFPANFPFDPELMESFFKLLPRDTNSATALARLHDKRVSGRSWTRKTVNRRLRHCVEIRNTSFVASEFIDLLRAYNVALVCADAVEWPRLMDVTSDFVYCRLHGSEQLYASGYDNKALDQWASRIAAWACGCESKNGEWASSKHAPRVRTRDVFVYFDNDAKVRAPVDAQALIKRVEKLLS